MPRLLAGATLALLGGLLAGCGNSTPPTTAATTGEPEASAPGVPASAPGVPDAKTPGADASGSPVVAVAGHELDAAKLVVPATPAAGTLGGGRFAPTEVTLTGNELTFAALQAGGVAGSLTVRFPAAGVKLADGFKLVVKSDEPESPALPGVEVFTTAGGKPLIHVYPNGYALSLELGKREAGKQPGKLALSLPDGTKGYLAGAFVAEARRAAGEPPGPDESPAVHGLVTLAGETKGELEVGLIGQPAGQVVTETVTLPVAGPPGRVNRVESVRRTALACGAGGEFRYEHVLVPAGRYLVWARQTPGPLAWQWVSVAAGVVTDAPLALDAKRAGKLAVTTTQPDGTLRLVPKDGDAAATVPELSLGLALRLEVASDAKAFDAVPPGRYDLVATLKAGTEWDRKPVEVKPGETVSVAIK